MDSLKILHTFCDNIRTGAKGIAIDQIDTEIMDMQFTDERIKFKKSDQRMILRFREKYGLELTEDTVRQFSVSSCALRWRRPATREKEGYLPGGFSFNGLTDIFESQASFWEKSVEEFKKVGEAHLIDRELLTKLRWIESPTPLIEAWYNPQFGCVKFEEGKFPDEFYFYDSGLIYLLPFQSFDEYIKALADSAAVIGWQYFYIDPELVIKKNNGVNYITWSQHISSELEEGLKSLTIKTDTRFDRLDLIDEYLERCIRLLPGSFPFINFGHHKKYYSAFRKLYSKSRTKK